MPELIQACDLAISAGGSTMWELAYFRVPSMVFVLADNQLSTARVLNRLDACKVIEDAVNLAVENLAEEIFRLVEDDRTRKSLADTFGGLLDGQGAARVCNELYGVQPCQTRSENTGDEGVVASL